MKKAILTAVLSCFVLLSSYSVFGGEVVHSLNGNIKIPEKEIRGFYSKEAWATIEDAPYDGCVIIRGSVKPNNVFRAGKIIESYPDDSRNKLALKLSKKVKLSSAKVGTRINPTADVYVLFYEENSDKRTALVFGKRRQSTHFSTGMLRDKYMGLFSY